MRNHVQMGDIVTLTAPYDVPAGGGFLVGSIFAVATRAALSGAQVEGQLTGVFDLSKAAGAVTQGQKIYWDNAAKLVTTTVGANVLIGAATLAAVGGAASARTRLNGTVV